MKNMFLLALRIVVKAASGSAAEPVTLDGKRWVDHWHNDARRGWIPGSLPTLG